MSRKETRKKIEEIAHGFGMKITDKNMLKYIINTLKMISKNINDKCDINNVEDILNLIEKSNKTIFYNGITFIDKMNNLNKEKKSE